MAATNINSHLGKNIEWTAYRNGHNELRCELTLASVAYDITALTFTAYFRLANESTNKLTLTQGSGLTNGGATGVLTLALTQANILASLPSDRYFIVVEYTLAGKVYPLTQGFIQISPETNPGTTSTTVTIPVSISGTTVSMAVTLSSITSASIASALGNQNANVVYAGPSSGAAAVPAFRTLVAADVPGSLILFTEKLDSYTLVLTDTALAMNKATALTLTVPPNSSVAFPIGTVLYVKRTGVGILTIAQGAGVTVTGSSGALTDAGLNVIMTLIKTGTNTWDLQNGSPGAYIDWIPTYTGFSVVPTPVVSRYSLIGKQCHIVVTMGGDGTSNSTSFEMTLPFAAASEFPSGQFAVLPTVVDNGAVPTTPGRMTFHAGSANATLHSSSSGGAWTGSGAKRAFINAVYEID